MYLFLVHLYVTNGTHRHSSLLGTHVVKVYLETYRKRENKIEYFCLIRSVNFLLSYMKLVCKIRYKQNFVKSLSIKI